MNDKKHTLKYCNKISSKIISIASTKLWNINTKFSAYNIGRGALAGGSVLGMGALCYYGLGLSNEPGALEKQQ